MTAFCPDCPDHEACATGYPCSLVKSLRDKRERASLRDGLPYRWWRSEQVWGAVIGALVAALALTMLTLVVLAWWNLLP